METLKVDRSKLITQSEFARERKISKQLVTYWIKTGKVKTIEIKGAILILQE